MHLAALLKDTKPPDSPLFLDDRDRVDRVAQRQAGEHFDALLDLAEEAVRTADIGRRRRERQEQLAAAGDDAAVDILRQRAIGN